MTVTIADNYNIRKQKQTSRSHNKKLINCSRRHTKQSKRTRVNDDTTISIVPVSSQIRQFSSSRHSSRRLQRTSIATTTTIHRNSSPPNSSSPSPVNLSRSTSPAPSVANFIRPISPPCIQVKEPLSPRFSRASSTIMTHDRHCSPPIVNNINPSTRRTTLSIDDSPGYDNQNSIRTVSNVPENCFEPETYRNLYPLNSNEPKKLSLSDPTLNQTRKSSNYLPQKSIVTNSTSTAEYFSASSLHQQLSNDYKHIQSDDDDDNEIENLSSSEEKIPMINQSQKINRKYSSPRHRIMTCTSGMNDSLIRLRSSSDVEHDDETSFYVMQNRPP
jgi:hypothetical protein